MRWLAALLFVFGIPWALIAVFGLTGPAVIAEEFNSLARARRPAIEYVLTATVFLSFTAQTVCGYVVWSRWLLIATGQCKSSRLFWALAAAHHLVWLLTFGPALMGMGGIMPLSLIAASYSLTLTTVCGVAAWTSRPPEPPRLPSAAA
mgnify:CR=1 FL=1